MLHLGIASVTRTAELAITEPEADMLAGAIVNVGEAFDVRPDPRTEAILALVVAAATVYGPRVYMVRKRHASEAEEASHGESLARAAAGL